MKKLLIAVFIIFPLFFPGFAALSSEVKVDGGVRTFRKFQEGFALPKDTSAVVPSPEHSPTNSSAPMLIIKTLFFCLLLREGRNCTFIYLCVNGVCCD